MGAADGARLYTAAEAQLHKVARLVREVRQRRRDAHDTAQAREVQMLLTLTCSRGAAGGRRRAAVTAEDAVRYCPSLAELGQKGRGMNFTAAGVKAQIRQVKEQIKAAETQQKQAARAAAAARADTQRKHAAEKKAAADNATAQRQAAERTRGIAESDERISRLWASAPQSDSEEEKESSDEEDDDDTTTVMTSVITSTPALMMKMTMTMMTLLTWMKGMKGMMTPWAGQSQKRQQHCSEAPKSEPPTPRWTVRRDVRRAARRWRSAVD